MSDEVKPLDGFEIQADKHESDAEDSEEEGRQPTYPDLFYGSDEDGPPIMFRVIPTELSAHKSLDSIVCCSPSRAASLGDLKVFSSVCPSLKGEAASVDGKSGESTTAKDELVAAAEDTESCANASFVVIRDGRYVGDNVEDEKHEEETVSPRDTSTTDIKSPTSRKKKHGVSALTLLLKMEAAKKDVPEITEGASGSDNGGNNGVQPLQNLREELPDLPPPPVRVWSTDGHPVIKENWSDFNPEELVTPLRIEEHQDGTVERPNMWQRCFMWCGRMFFRRDYEEI